MFVDYRSPDLLGLLLCRIPLHRLDRIDSDYRQPNDHGHRTDPDGSVYHASGQADSTQETTFHRHGS